MMDNQTPAHGCMIRPALPEHLPHLAAVEQAAATVFPPGSIPDAARGDSLPLPLLEEAMGAGTLWVALGREGEGTNVAGFALLRIVDGLALLAQIDVRPEFARQGLGQALVACVSFRARELGHDALYLTTFRHIPWNAPFYARLGFAALSRKDTPPLLLAALREENARGFKGRVAMRRDLKACPAVSDPIISE